MFRFSRHLIGQISRFPIHLHVYIKQNYLKVLTLCSFLATASGSICWLSHRHPALFHDVQKNLHDFPIGVTFGVLTVALISCLLLYAIHLETVQKTVSRSRSAIRLKYIDYILLTLAVQLRNATERHLQQTSVDGGTLLAQDRLDAMNYEIEDCIDQFRENARKLLHGPRASGSMGLQQLEEFFRVDQRGSGVGVGEDILKLKRKSKPLLSEQAIKELLAS